MSPFTGWAVALNGVMITAACESDFEALDCFPMEVLEGMEGAPEGLDLPDERTEDVTYYQRDGRAMFSDFYEGRDITIVGTIGSPDDCEETCSRNRQLVQDAVQAWKRGPTTELVIYPDCYQTDLTTGVNEYPDGTFDADTDGWTGDGGCAVARVTTPVQAGAGALRITWGTDTAGDETASGPVYDGEPQTSYIVKAWLYADVGQPAPMFGVTDSLGADPVFSDPIVADGTYHYVEVVYPVGASGEVVPFTTSSEDTTSGDIAYIDEVEMVQINPNVNRDLNGPFGAVGRPRAFKYKWDPAHKVADFTARFECLDHRLFVLDGCGTPGHEECSTIQPGPQLYSLCSPICDTGGGICATNPVEGPGSVAPTEIVVGGTEKVNPTITLFPPLVSPRVENITTGEYVILDTTLVDPNTPVTLNTEDGTAFDADGNSLTYLLRGSLFLSMDPGIYSWRLLSNGDAEDSGFMTLCFRPTVVSG